MDLDELSPEERAWLQRDEAVWRRARSIVERNPQLDVGDVYHALINLQRTPAQRLARGLAHARLRARPSTDPRARSGVRRDLRDAPIERI